MAEQDQLKLSRAETSSRKVSGQGSKKDNGADNRGSKGEEEKEKVSKVERPSSPQRPNFSGLWRSVKSENMKEFLISQGIEEKIAVAAEGRQITQEIDHRDKDNLFVVKTGSHSKSYSIGGSTNLDEVFGNQMSWEGDLLVSRPFFMNESSNKVVSFRKMSGKQMVFTLRNEKEEAKRYFERIPAAVSPKVISHD
mmetsp:Transcript_15869/g.26180  ORF Transcript_15869/g.26180 Transcript_15869/m.26180 type:complete len:195 (+) Transcript_15869:241-825(+)